MSRPPRPRVGRNGASEISVLEIIRLQHVSYGNTYLYNVLDNAGQTVVYSSMFPFHQEVLGALRAMYKESGGEELSNAATSAIIDKIRIFHLGVMSRNRKYSLTKEDFQRFYSLIYHLTPQGDQNSAAMERIFTELHVPPLMTREEVIACLPDIVTLLDRAAESRPGAPPL